MCWRTHLTRIFFCADTLDVGVIAQALGGGGHNHSAATIVEGDLDEVVNNTVERLKMMLEED